ncbi:zf-HC2 domain-containing protein [Streptosporangium sp. NPDC000563]|uniref:zf-HC2 domain-containing protein n=1 Tax=Streptosporangium sp. NPDC000563 TaxID=3154366 RepID=UPI00331B6CA5
MGAETSQGDAELLAATRNGDVAAYRLLHRRHAPATRALARLLLPGASEAEDLVEKAFAEIHHVIAQGHGPEQAFRVHLFTVLRRIADDRSGTAGGTPAVPERSPGEAPKRADGEDEADEGAVERATGAVADEPDEGDEGAVGRAAGEVEGGAEEGTVERTVPATGEGAGGETGERPSGEAGGETGERPSGESGGEVGEETGERSTDGETGRADGETDERADGEAGPFDPRAFLVDPSLRGLERSPVARAFLSLPERWQFVLWHAEVERLRIEDVGLLLGLTVNGAAALAHRAKEGMRQACLRIHLAETSAPECRPVLTRLGPHTRGGLDRERSRVIERHLEGCSGCRAVLTELTGIGHGVRSVIGPLVAGPAFPAYLTALARMGATVGGGGLSGRWRRAPRSVRRAVAAGAMATSVVVAAALVLVSTEEPVRWPSTASEPIVVAPVPDSPDPEVPEISEAPVPSPSGRSAESGRGPEETGAAPGSVAGAPLDGESVETGPGDRAGGSEGGASAGAGPGGGPGGGQGGRTGAWLAPRLVARIDALGALVRSEAGIVVVRLRNAGRGQSEEVVADVGLPRGVTLPSGSRRGNAVGGVTPVGTVDGWSCRARNRGARCVRGPLPAGRATAVFLRVLVSDEAAYGTSPSVTVTTAGTRVEARSRSRVRATGAPARFATDGRVAVSAIGNTLVSCASSEPACEAARSRRGGRRDNNNWEMRPIDHDGDPSTSSSSAARLALPAASKVVWAGLYWSASAPPGGRIKLKVPGEERYRQVRATQVVERELPAGRGYQAFADVTRLLGRVRGTYWVADASVRSGVARHAGWSLVVIVADPRRPYSQAVVVDTTEMLDGENRSARIPLEGLTPSGVPARMSLVTWEGDAGVGGDRVRLGGRTLRPAGGERDPGNPFDGSAAGARGTGTTFGTDVDRFRAPLGRDPVLEISTREDVLLFGVAAVSVRTAP